MLNLADVAQRQHALFGRVAHSPVACMRPLGGIDTAHARAGARAMVRRLWHPARAQGALGLSFATCASFTTTMYTLAHKCHIQPFVHEQRTLRSIKTH